MDPRIWVEIPRSAHYRTEWSSVQIWDVRNLPDIGERDASKDGSHHPSPPARSSLICVDETGPIAVKTYPGAEWEMGPQRATSEPADG